MAVTTLPQQHHQNLQQQQYSVDNTTGSTPTGSTYWGKSTGAATGLPSTTAGGTPVHSLGIVVDRLCQIALRLTIYLIVVAAPIYTAMSLIQGTYTHQYAWTVSLAFWSGAFAFSLAFTVLALFLMIYTLLSAYYSDSLSSHEGVATNAICNSSLDTTTACNSCDDVGSSGTNAIPVVDGNTSTSGNSNITPATPTSENKNDDNTTSSSSNMKVWRRWWLFMLLNLSIMICADVAYVYTVIYGSSNLQVLAQVLLSVFKLLWNNFCCPHLIRYLRYMDSINTIAAAAAEEQEEEDHSSMSGNNSSVHISRVYIHLFSTLLNNIAIPCLVVMAISPNCLYYAFVAAPEVSAAFTYNACTQFNAAQQCEQYRVTVVDTSYEPPFTYSNQCSSSFITYYAPALVIMSIGSAFIMPLLNSFGASVSKNIYNRQLRRQQQVLSSSSCSSSSSSRSRSCCFSWFVMSDMKRFIPTVLRPELLALKLNHWKRGENNVYSSKRTQTPSSASSAAAAVTTAVESKISSTSTASAFNPIVSASMNAGNTAAASTFIADASGSTSSSTTSTTTTTTTTATRNKGFGRMFGRVKYRNTEEILASYIETWLVVLFSNIGMLVTFGAVFPPLAAAFCITCYSVTINGKCIIGRFVTVINTLTSRNNSLNQSESTGNLAPINTSGSPPSTMQRPHSAAVDKENTPTAMVDTKSTSSTSSSVCGDHRTTTHSSSHAFLPGLSVSVKIFMNLLWMMLSFSCCFYTLFLFDTLGASDTSPNASAPYWVLVVVPLLPAVLYYSVYQLLRCFIARSHATTATATAAATSIERTAAVGARSGSGNASQNHQQLQLSTLSPLPSPQQQQQQQQQSIVELQTINDSV